MSDGQQGTADRDDALRVRPDGLGHRDREQRQHAQPRAAQPEGDRGQRERGTFEAGDLRLAGGQQRCHRGMQPQCEQVVPAGYHDGQRGSGGQAEQRRAQRPRRRQRRRGGAPVLPGQAPAGQAAERAGQPGEHQPAQHGDEARGEHGGGHGQRAAGTGGRAVRQAGSRVGSGSTGHIMAPAGPGVRRGHPRPWRAAGQAAGGANQGWSAANRY